VVKVLCTGLDEGIANIKIITAKSRLLVVRSAKTVIEAP
jgi:hypothetical protein